MAEPAASASGPEPLDLPAGLHQLCSCGRSQHGWFCDGAHLGSERVSYELRLNQAATVPMCRCGRPGPLLRRPAGGRAAAWAEPQPLAAALANWRLAGSVWAIAKSAPTSAAGATWAVPATSGGWNSHPCAAPRLDRHGPRPGRQRGGSAAPGIVWRRGLAAGPRGQPPAAARVACLVPPPGVPPRLSPGLPV